MGKHAHAWAAKGAYVRGRWNLHGLAGYAAWLPCKPRHVACALKRHRPAREAPSCLHQRHVAGLRYRRHSCATAACSGACGRCRCAYAFTPATGHTAHKFVLTPCALLLQPPAAANTYNAVPPRSGWTAWAGAGQLGFKAAGACPCVHLPRLRVHVHLFCSRGKQVPLACDTRMRTEI